ncbi:uncharacterized protein EKO05_0000075 [Ascochyta rabiei]|uniref:uncharacterized protein n=1 Tax=Didymella rabiei TaxID=5454 RepID=UPI0021FFED17|nr:uncharacterized protein EKO05_0000075 [Ascochyta rabiei]UPX09385.1 hypothetical protein EKO05_0000075 [Ascochyta rabiei]
MHAFAVFDLHCRHCGPVVVEGRKSCRGRRSLLQASHRQHRTKVRSSAGTVSCTTVHSLSEEAAPIQCKSTPPACHLNFRASHIQPFHVDLTPADLYLPRTPLVSHGRRIDKEVARTGVPLPQEHVKRSSSRPSIIVLWYLGESRVPWPVQCEGKAEAWQVRLPSFS